jgi:hypothetical protein
MDNLYEGPGVYDDLGERVGDVSMHDMMRLLEYHGYNQVLTREQHILLMEEEPEDV